MWNLDCCLGSYEDREEFQVDQTIIWVLVPADDSRVFWIERARTMLPSIQAIIPKVIAAAEPAAETIGLLVRGIWIDPRNDVVDFDIVEDTTKHSLEQSKQENDWSVIIRRQSDGSLLSVIR